MDFNQTRMEKYSQQYTFSNMNVDFVAVELHAEDGTAVQITKKYMVLSNRCEKKQEKLS